MKPAKKLGPMQIAEVMAGAAQKKAQKPAEPDEDDISAADPKKKLSGGQMAAIKNKGKK